MRVTVGATIRIEQPSAEIERWRKDHLILPNPDYAKKIAMGFWVGETEETLSLYERHGNVLELPFGTIRQILPFCEKVEASFRPPTKVDYGGQPVPLYDYQEEAVEMLWKCKYGILQSAAGSGKTQMGIALVKKWGVTALWLTHTADLLKQSMDRAKLYMDPSVMGVITGGKVEIGSGITFATVQTMSKLDLTKYRDMWDVVICDECHHCVGGPTKVTMYYRVLDSLRARHKYGLSATVHRSDGLVPALHALLGETVWKVPDEAVKDRIMKAQVMPVGTGTPPSEECLRPDGTLDFTGLINYLTEDEDRNALIRDCILKEKGRSCLILSDRIDHLTDLMNGLPPDMREDAVMVTGKMTSKTGKAEREAALDRMRSGEKKYLFASYALAKEGLDIPQLERLFMATPVKDEAVVIQAVGRVCRTNPGKETPLVYDFVDNIRYCQRAYKQRCRHYRKIDATVL